MIPTIFVSRILAITFKLFWYSNIKNNFFYINIFLNKIRFKPSPITTWKTPVKIRAFPPRSSPRNLLANLLWPLPSLSSSPDPSHRLAATEPGQPPFSSHLEPSTFPPGLPHQYRTNPLSVSHLCFLSIDIIRSSSPWSVCVFYQKNNTDRSVQPPINSRYLRH